jgi:pSer/pThr/pTyr-binding forkhead associated (FHA) protein
VSASPLQPHAATPADLRERLAAERRGSPFLLYRDDEDRQHIVELGADRSRITLGRSERNDLPLRWDAEVSRIHAQLERVGDEWILIDDELSRNGTFVDGERIHGRRRLRGGELIAIGDTRVAFLAPAGAFTATVTARHPLAGITVTPAQHRVLVALCRPLLHGPVPASNREIADELVVAVDTVKGSLSRLFGVFGLGADVPQNQKRAGLARRALDSGIVRRDEL